MTHKLSLFLMLLTAFVFSLAAVALPVHVTPVRAAPSGTVITVTVTNDELNADVDCSLREAIRAANLDIPVSGCPAGSGADTIVLGATTYNLSIPGANENAGLTGDLDITSTLTIQGVLSSTTIIDGNGATTGDRVLHIFFTAVTITGVTVTDGRTSSVGGGIASEDSTLLLSNSAVSNNHSTGSSGGGVFNGGDMLMINSTIASNTAATSGGGIHNNGPLTITRSAVRDNTASSFAGGGIFSSGGFRLAVLTSTVRNNHADDVSDGEGGGIYHSSGLVIIQASTIRDNSAGDSGGVYISSGILTITAGAILSNTAISAGGLRNNGTTAIVNSTIAHNRANPGGAGGIANGAGGALLTLYNVTIAGNVSTNGGGLHNGGGGSVSVRNTLIANNTGGGAPDCLGPLLSLGYNLVENTTGCSFALSNDITGSDPQFAAPVVTDNGGPTLSFALLSASPAVDGGRPTGCLGPGVLALTTDQRGFIRPVDGDNAGGAQCDIGAYEYNSGAPVDLLVSKTGPAFVGLPATAASSITYVIRITNTSAGTAMGVKLTDTMPAGGVINLVFGTGSCVYGGGFHTIGCTIGPINPLAVHPVTITARLSGTLPVCGSLLLNSIVVTATGETNPANNSATGQSVIGCPDVALAKLGPSLIISPSTTAGSVHYRITLTNAGNMPLSSIRLTDTLPAGMQFSSAAGVACSGTTVPVCTFPGVAIGAAGVFTLTAQLFNLPACGALVTNALIAWPKEGDLNPANNSAASQSRFACARLFLPVLSK